MAALKLTNTIKKSISITVTDALLTETAYGGKLESPKVYVINGLKCWIQWFPNGNTKDDIGYVSVYLWVSSPVKTTWTFTLVGSNIKENAGYLFLKSEGRGCPKLATHQQVRNTFQNGTATIVCDADFEVELCSPRCMTHNIFETSDEIPFDCEFVVGDERIEVHKHLLALVSPSLYANFTHDTVESKTEKVIITDFDFKTVKASIDFLYGRGIQDAKIKTIIGMLRFFDKYNIKSHDLEKVPHNNIKNESFWITVHYAYDCCKDLLFNECATFFSKNHKAINNQESSEKIPVKLSIRLLENAFSVTSVYDVLRKAHQNNICGVNDHLDPTLVLTVDSFCEIASYAWDCKRSDLQTKCAQFLTNKDYRADITITEKFTAMGNTCLLVLKATRELAE